MFRPPIGDLAWRGGRGDRSRGWGSLASRPGACMHGAWACDEKGGHATRLTRLAFGHMHG
jgi:hypothetical protein